MNAGYTLKWNRVLPWENALTAHNAHTYNDYSGLERMVDRILEPV